MTHTEVRCNIKTISNFCLPMYVNIKLENNVEIDVKSVELGKRI